MTEVEWVTSDDPAIMLKFVDGASERKLRLFACACARRVWNLYVDARAWRAIEAAEEHAERMTSEEALRVSRDNASALLLPNPATHRDRRLRHLAISINSPYAWDAARQASKWATYSAAPESEADRKEESAIQVLLLRDLFGIPFRPITFSRALSASTVAAVAQAAYDERSLPAGTLDPDRLAVLADALEDAGCDNADILNHLRSPGPHVRGCWALDLLLGKE